MCPIQPDECRNSWTGCSAAAAFSVLRNNFSVVIAACLVSLDPPAPKEAKHFGRNQGDINERRNPGRPIGNRLRIVVRNVMTRRLDDPLDVDTSFVCFLGTPE